LKIINPLFSLSRPELVWLTFNLEISYEISKIQKRGRVKARVKVG